jgi:hypothetical protein
MLMMMMMIWRLPSYAGSAAIHNRRLETSSLLPVTKLARVDDGGVSRLTCPTLHPLAVTNQLSALLPQLPFIAATKLPRSLEASRERTR